MRHICICPKCQRLIEVNVNHLTIGGTVGDFKCPSPCEYFLRGIIPETIGRKKQIDSAKGLEPLLTDDDLTLLRGMCISVCDIPQKTDSPLQSLSTLESETSKVSPYKESLSRGDLERYSSTWGKLLPNRKPDSL